MSPALRKMRLQHRMRLGNPREWLVFTNSDGGPTDPRNFARRQFKLAVRMAGIGKDRFLDLRHSFGSLKIEQGENIKYVQVQIGHSDIQGTLNVYAHLLKETNSEAAAKPDLLIFGTA